MGTPCPMRRVQHSHQHSHAPGTVHVRLCPSAQPCRNAQEPGGTGMPFGHVQMCMAIVLHGCAHASWKLAGSPPAPRRCGSGTQSARPMLAQIARPPERQIPVRRPWSAAVAVAATAQSVNCTRRWSPSPHQSPWPNRSGPMAFVYVGHGLVHAVVTMPVLTLAPTPWQHSAREPTRSASAIRSAREGDPGASESAKIPRERGRVF